MPKSTKINFISSKVHRLSDYTELVELLFPGNKNQQHAAASVLFELKSADTIIPNLCYIENKYGVSRRTLQRTRAKLSRLGLIEHISYLNSRYGGNRAGNYPRGLVHPYENLLNTWIYGANRRVPRHKIRNGC